MYPEICPAVRLDFFKSEGKKYGNVESVARLPQI